MKLFSFLFEYNDIFAQKKILKAFYLVIYLNRQRADIDDLITDFTDLELPRFLLEINGKIEELNDSKTEEELMKSQPKLQKSPLTWAYYSLYFGLKLAHNTAHDYKNDQNIQAVTYMVLRYHQNYLKYKKLQAADPDVFPNKLSFFKDATQTLVRMLEYLLAFVDSKEEYLLAKYFSSFEIIDIEFLEHFSDTNDREQLNFYIKHDKKVGNFLVYENKLENIHIQIESSRMLRKGAKHKDTFYNRNIVNYLASKKELYLKIRDLKYKKNRSGGGVGGYHTNEIQDTEEEEFLKNTSKKSLNVHGSLEQTEVYEILSKEKIQRRAFPENGEKQEVPNSYKQYLRNKAFSANFTKRSLLLSTSYDIPPVPILQKFLAYTTKEPISEDILIEDVYKVIFLLDCFLGLGYIKIIQIFLEDSNDIKLDNSYLKIKVRKELFAKSTNNDYLQKADNNLIYKIPHCSILLINKIKSFFREKENKELKTFYTNDAAQSYFKYMKLLIKNFDKKIYFNPNQIWKVVNSYRRSLFYEDMSTMFCTGRYQQNDTASLSYASTNKRALNHSLVVEKLYNKLELNKHIGELLNIDCNLFNSTMEFTNSTTYSGSSMPVLPEQNRNFFNKIKYLIQSEENKEHYFNLISIYTRYALSLLVGTRPFESSINIKNISFTTHTLIINEKATTQLLGIRMIPLCHEIETIIKDYKQLCDEYGIPDDKIYLLNDGQHYPYNVNQVRLFLNSFEMSQDLIDFIRTVPVNTGRHVITKFAMESNFNIYYLKALLGHYMAGGEHLGVFSTLNIPDYINKSRLLTSNIAKIYGV